MHISQHGKGMLAAIAAAFCAGLATVMSKALLEQVSPITLLTLQLLASSVLLWSLILLKKYPLPKPKALMAVASLGLLEPGLAYLLGLIGLQSISASASTLIQALEAIMIVIASFILLNQRPSLAFIGLSLVAFIGLSLALDLWQMTPSTNSPTGITLLLAATASAAVYVVLSSRLAQHYPPLVLVGIQHTTALIMTVCFLPLETLFSQQGIQWPQTSTVWFWVIASGIVQYALTFSFYLYALTKISANLSGSFLNLIPVFGLGIACLVLGEQLSKVQILGTLITIIAVMFLHPTERVEADTNRNRHD